jgi:glutathione S-transferase
MSITLHLLSLGLFATPYALRELQRRARAIAPSASYRATRRSRASPPASHTAPLIAARPARIRAAPRRRASTGASAFVSSLRGGAKAPGYKLTYFDARGAAELARIVLVASKTEWDDVRFPIAMVDGKPAVPEFQAAKESGALKVNMDRAPLLELEGGFAIGQSRAIERFLARRHGLFGADELEGAMIDAVVEHTRDIKEAYSRAVPPFGPDSEEKAAKLATWYGETLPGWLARLERALPAASGAHCAVGGALSLADLAIWQLLKDNFQDVAGAAAAAKGCPRLNAIADGVAALPQIAGYVAGRPKTMM